MDVTLEELKRALEKSWSKETCHHDCLWENPKLPNSAGHCRVTSLIVQDYFGGEILYSYANGNKEWDHYWNRLPDGKEVDFTINQFPKNAKFVEVGALSREEVMDSSITKKGYKILKKKVKNLLNG